MRTVWAQATRPRLSCAPIPRSSLKSIAARRSAAANAARSNIAACDVFALFLGPVLAVAAFADVSWKDKRRKEWEQCFNEINQQLELLRAREVEIWTRIQFRSVRHGVLQQKRMYSSAATAVAQVQASSSEDVESEQPKSPSELDPGLTPTEDNMASPLDLTGLTYRPGDIFEPSRSSQTAGDLAADAPLIHYEKLLALRLALRMILHNQTGSDDMHADAFCDNAAPQVAADDIGRVVLRLRAVTEELEAIDRRRELARQKIAFRPDSQDDLDNWHTRRKEILELGHLFRNKQIDVAGLVDRISQWLLRSGSNPPGPMLYAELVMLFSLNNLSDLARFAVSALQNTSFALSDHEICLMLDHSSISRNMKAYDWVIENLTNERGLLATESARWEWKRISGILLPLPIDRSPRLLRALIRTSLNFKDPQRAEAYAMIESTTYSHYMMGYVIKAFLQYYTRTADWANAYVWLRKTEWWIAASRSLIPNGMSAIMCRVLDTLLAFDRTAQYEKLLQAAVNTGIEPPNLESRGRDGTDRMRRVVTQWQKLINTAGSMALVHPTNPGFSRFKSRLRSVVAELQHTAPQAEESFVDQPPPVGAARGMEREAGRLEDAVQRSELALSRLDEQIAESQRLRAELEKQPSLTQSNISELQEFIKSERDNFKRARLEQERAMREQEATVAALRTELRRHLDSQSDISMLKELVEKERESFKRIRLKQDKAMKKQQATVEALQTELRRHLDPQSEQQKYIQATGNNIENQQLPSAQHEIRTRRDLQNVLEEVFCASGDTTVSDVLAWAEEAASVSAVPHNWRANTEDTPMKAHRFAKRYIVTGIKYFGQTPERIRAVAEIAWAEARKRKLRRWKPDQSAAANAASPAGTQNPEQAPGAVDTNDLENDSGYDSDSSGHSSPGGGRNAQPKDRLRKVIRPVKTVPPERFRDVAGHAAIRRIAYDLPDATARRVKPKMPPPKTRARSSPEETVDALDAWEATTPANGAAAAAAARDGYSLFPEPIVDLRGGAKVDRG